jgi:hypothetical protein
MERSRRTSRKLRVTACAQASGRTEFRTYSQARHIRTTLLGLLPDEDGNREARTSGNRGYAFRIRKRQGNQSAVRSHAARATYDFHASLLKYGFTGGDGTIKTGDKIDFIWFITGSTSAKAYRYTFCKVPTPGVG